MQDEVNNLLGLSELSELDDILYWDLGSLQQNFLQEEGTNNIEKAHGT